MRTSQNIPLCRVGRVHRSFSLVVAHLFTPQSWFLRRCRRPRGSRRSRTTSPRRRCAPRQERRPGIFGLWRRLGWNDPGFLWNHLPHQTTYAFNFSQVWLVGTSEKNICKIFTWELVLNSKTIGVFLLVIDSQDKTGFCVVPVFYRILWQKGEVVLKTGLIFMRYGIGSVLLKFSPCNHGKFWGSVPDQVFYFIFKTYWTSAKILEAPVLAVAPLIRFSTV